MTSRQKYTLPKGRKSEKLIKDTAEILNEQKEKITFINWESFTFDYMKFDIPVANKDNIDYVRWVQMRPTWIESINKEFAKSSLPCYLVVDPSRGVFVLTNGEAFKSSTTKRIRKLVSTITKTVEMSAAMQNSFPELKKAFAMIGRVHEDTLHALSGRIDISRLPVHIKNDLKKMIQDNLRTLELEEDEDESY